jgi:hypothetical protein
MEEGGTEMGSVVDHPAAALMREVEAEQAIVEMPEATALIEKVFQSVSDYWNYLERHGLIYDYNRNLLRASALHVICDALGCEIMLKDGPIDRRYNGGDDPDLFTKGFNPTWPPRGKDP